MSGWVFKGKLLPYADLFHDGATGSKMLVTKNLQGESNAGICIKEMVRVTSEGTKCFFNLSLSLLNDYSKWMCSYQDVTR